MTPAAEVQAETPAETVHRTRTAQGLPPQVTDPTTIKRVHYLLSTATYRRGAGR